MKLKLQSDNLILKLKELEKESLDILSTSNKAIILCRNLLTRYKKHIVKNGFECPQDEIEFFKNTKQPTLTNLIYYSEVRSFEIQFPKVNEDAQKKYVKKKISKLNRFSFTIWILGSTLNQTTLILTSNITLENTLIISQ